MARPFVLVSPHVRAPSNVTMAGATAGRVQQNYRPSVPAPQPASEPEEQKLGTIKFISIAMFDNITIIPL